MCSICWKKLCMSNPGSGVYFDSCASEEIYKRIALLPSGFTEKFKEKISKYYGKPQTILDELSAREADEILTKISQRESELNSEIRQILIYPPGKGGISINTEDYGSLEQDKYLNDVIIDFYLKYLCNEILTEEMRNKTHVFSTFFYTRLSTKVDNMSRYDNSDMDYSSAQQHYNRVKNWTKNVNIFDKDFIIIPINENQHWYLAIVCFPGLKDGQLTSEKDINNTNKREGDRSLGSSNDFKYAFPRDGSHNLYDDEDDSNNSESNQNYLDLGANKSGSVKQPCILIFDSLSGGAIISRQRTISVIRDYLSCEHQSKFGTAYDFDKYSMRGHCVKVPQQDNLTDCGLFILQYVEQFFKVPITDFSIPIRGLENWFETIVVTRKREDISKLIKKLVADYNADNLPLPDIIFPTLNGKLVEQVTLETADEFKDHFADVEVDDEFADDDYNESEYNDDENEQNFEEEIYETQHKNMKRRATDSESECESRVRRRFKENIEDETVYNGRA